MHVLVEIKLASFSRPTGSSVIRLGQVTCYTLYKLVNVVLKVWYCVTLVCDMTFILYFRFVFDNVCFKYFDKTI